MPDLSSHAGPRYQAIAAAIADAVDQGELAPGDKLPPQRDLAYRLGVTVGTVSRGYMLAEQQGLVGGEVGRGTFVRTAARGGTEPILQPAETGVIDLGINMATWRVHGDALAEALQEIAQAQGLEDLLRYVPAAGHAKHRAVGARFMARIGLEVDPACIVLTHGAQQALTAVFGALCSAGDTVLAESYSYSGVIENARIAGVHLEGVALDEEGLVPEALDEAAGRTGARVVIVVPTIQNPTAAMMGAERRAAIARVAEARDLIIVEDDVYGYLLPDRPPPIASLAPERTVYFTSASKCLAPGLRVGWMALPPRFVERFIDVVYAQTVAQPALCHEIIGLWLENGTADRLTEALRREIAARQSIAMEVFDGLAVRGHPASFHLMLDLPAPWRRDEYVAAALAQGIRIVSIASFAVDPAKASEAVRISLAAAADREALTAALNTLRDMALTGPRASRAVV
ncbi:MAG TPA: PLP-dependent aminotransferase family protein [Alphaproteobacteria bacterium]|nr:PLP-dependent aminotransferase family protein [Alphaproteobacteria bacterium]